MFNPSFVKSEFIKIKFKRFKVKQGKREEEEEENSDFNREIWKEINFIIILY